MNPGLPHQAQYGKYSRVILEKVPQFCQKNLLLEQILEKITRCGRLIWVFQEEHQDTDMDSEVNKADNHNFCRTNTISSHLGFSIKTLAATLYQFLSAHFKVNQTLNR